MTIRFSQTSQELATAVEAPSLPRSLSLQKQIFGNPEAFASTLPVPGKFSSPDDPQVPHATTDDSDDLSCWKTRFGFLPLPPVDRSDRWLRRDRRTDSPTSSGR